MIHDYVETTDPASAPPAANLHWTNSSSGDVFLSNGTATVANWVKVKDAATAGDALTTDGLDQFAATTSAELAGVISDATGTNLAVFNTSPTFITPTLGVASATSLNLGSSVFSQLSSNHVSVANGANAQSFSVYNVAGTDYERGVIDWQTTAGVLTIGTQNGGAGSARNINLVVGGVRKLDYGISSSGNWTFGAPILSSYIWLTSHVDIGAGGAEIRFYSPSSGVLRISDTGGTSFDRIQFGGTTPSFPCEKRRGAALETRLADDSAITTHILAHLVKAGAVSDSDFTNPVDGIIAINSTGSLLCARVGGVWKTAVLV